MQSFSLFWQNHLYFRRWTFSHTSLAVVHAHHNLRFPLPLLQCHTCCPLSKLLLLEHHVPPYCCDLPHLWPLFIWQVLEAKGYYWITLLYLIEGTWTQIWKFNLEKIDLKRFCIAHLVFHEHISPEIQTCSWNVNRMHDIGMGNTLIN